MATEVYLAVVVTTIIMITVTHAIIIIIVSTIHGFWYMITAQGVGIGSVSVDSSSCSRRFQSAPPDVI